MQRQRVTSSTITSVGYDAGSRTLEVEFTSGAVYRYRDVPERVHAELLGSDSLGRYFNEHIRDRYVYVRL
jgi:hypothetical protein